MTTPSTPDAVQLIDALIDALVDVAVNWKRSVAARPRFDSAVANLRAAVSSLSERAERAEALAKDAEEVRVWAVEDFYSERDARKAVDKVADDLRARVVSLEAERDAWENFADHVAGCVECGQTSWTNCSDGLALREPILAARHGAATPDTETRETDK